MTDQEWEQKWQDLVKRAEKIKYEKNKPWSMTATGASASCSFISLGGTGVTFSITGASLSITGFALSFTGVWGKVVGHKFKSCNGYSKLEAKKQAARVLSNDEAIALAELFLADKDEDDLALTLAASRLE